MNGAGFVHAPTTKSGGLIGGCRNTPGTAGALLLRYRGRRDRNLGDAACDGGGVWMVTTKGDCIASYRYPCASWVACFANGGDIAINVSSRVAADGAVIVVVNRGDTHASGLQPARRQCRQWLMEDDLVRRFMDRRAAP